MGDDADIFRNTNGRLIDMREGMSRAEARSVPPPGDAMAVRVDDGGSMPAAVPGVFLTTPVSLAGPEAAGQTGAYSAAGAQTPVTVLGPTVPAAGDLLVARRVGGRWVADRHRGHGTIGPPLGPCPFNVYVAGCNFDRSARSYIQGAAVTVDYNGTNSFSGVTGTGGFFSADLTALSGGYVEVTASAAGFDPQTVRVTNFLRPCGDHLRAGGTTLVLAPDSGHVCCSTSVPLGPRTSFRCPRPFPKTLNLSSVGGVTLTYSDALGGWYGTKDMVALVCTYDAYGNCASMGMTGTTPLAFFYSCGPFGGLSVSLRVTNYASDPAYTGPLCHPVPACTPTDGSCGNWLGDSGALSQWMPPYGCLTDAPQTFLFEDFLWYTPPLGRSRVYPCPNPAAGLATLSV